MFVILTYDVNSKRVHKVMKTCRRYLSHEQRSVFEGMITDAKLERLKREISNLVDTEEDSIEIYEFKSLKYVSKEKLGVAGSDDNVI